MEHYMSPVIRADSGGNVTAVANQSGHLQIRLPFNQPSQLPGDTICLPKVTL